MDEIVERRPVNIPGQDVPGWMQSRVVRVICQITLGISASPFLLLLGAAHLASRAIRHVRNEPIEVRVREGVKNEERNKFRGMQALYEAECKNLDFSHNGEFDAAWTELTLTLEDAQNRAERHPADCNRRFLRQLRTLLNSEYYQKHKEDPDNPHVLALHRFAVAMWDGAYAIDEFSQLGETILQEMDDAHFEDKSLAEKISSSQAFVASRYNHNDTCIGRMLYAITRPKRMLGALASEGGAARVIAWLFGREVYDGHGKLANNPSLLGTMEWNEEKPVHICYGGSPTIGDGEVAPEYEALCQAVQNNRKREFPIASIPCKISYNSLQDWNKHHGEGPRSETLMRLAENYPESFSLMILSKDSALYQGRDPEIIYETAEQFAAAYEVRMSNNFDDPEQQKIDGCYFPEFLKDQLGVACAIARGSCEALDGDNRYTAAQKATIFQECFYSAMILLKQRALAKEEPSRLTFVLEITACKENIDRGAMENLKIVCLTANEAPINLLIGIEHARAAHVRKRTILKKRVAPVAQFLAAVSKETFAAQCAAQGLQVPEFKVARRED